MSSNRGRKITNHKTGKTIVALILDAYREYCAYGYPNDPGVYVIRANRNTMKRLSDYIQSLTFKNANTRWNFQRMTENRLRDGEVVFGPEQVEMYWSDMK